MTAAVKRGWCAVLVLAAQTAAGPASLGAARLVDVTTARGVFDGAPVGVTDVFSPDAPAGYDDGSPRPFARGSVVVTSDEDYGEFHCELPAGRRWRTGAYRVDLLIDGNVLAQAQFTVAVDTESPDASKGLAPSRDMRPR